jgi:hypothetical protein
VFIGTDEKKDKGCGRQFQPKKDEEDIGPVFQEETQADECDQKAQDEETSVEGEEQFYDYK